MITTTRWLGRIAGIVALVLLIAITPRVIDFGRLVEALASVRPGWVVLACACYASILSLWAWQWHIIAPRVVNNTWRRMLNVVTLTSATLNTTPLLVGEVAGAMLLATRIGISAAEAVSVSAMDQLLVGIAKVGVITAAALTNTLPPWMTSGLLTLVAGVTLLLSFCVAVAFTPDAQRWPVSRLRSPRIASAVVRFSSTLAPLRALDRAAPALLLALAKKAVEVTAIICIQHAFGVSLPISSALLVLAALNLATLVPLVPGNLGVYEGVVVVAYVSLGMTPERAAAMAVVQHACYFASLALPGYAWAAAEGVSRSIAAAR